MTALGRHLDEELIAQMMERSKARAEAAGEQPDPGGMKFKTVEAGAATQVWASVASDLADHNGAYLADCQVGVEGANPSKNGFAPHLLDDVDTERLWALSQEWCGITYP